MNMELNIGTNIKRLRLEKGMTQEHLASLLSVSTAAVCKWEAQNTYPDITLLFPLAGIFGISVDALLGYDEARTKAEIDTALTEYRRLYVEGRFAEAAACITAARKKYPHDYRIMNAYMWDKAGGKAGCGEELLQNREEISEICTCILDGCREETLRLEALDMQAKILHAEGDTAGALEILSNFPSWAHTSEQKKEQLFAKDTAEFRYWNRRNCLGLVDIMAIKLARTVRFDPTLSTAEKLRKGEAIGDAFAEMGQKPALSFFCIGEEAVYAALAGMLTAEDPIADVIRLREKQFAALEKMMCLAKTDEILYEALLRTYKTDDLVAWELNRLLHSPHPQFAELRQHPAYMEMLNKRTK